MTRTRASIHKDISRERARPKVSVGRGGGKTYWNPYSRKYETARVHFARLAKERREANKRRKKRGR